MSVPVAGVRSDGLVGDGTVAFTTVGAWSSTQLVVRVLGPNGAPLDAPFEVIVMC
jgi:hypothetical protein